MPSLTELSALLPSLRPLLPDTGLLLVDLGAVFAIVLTTLGFLALRPGPDRARSRLAVLATRQKTLREIEMEQPFTDRVLRPMIGYFSRLLLRLLPLRSRSQERGLTGLQKRLILAGSPHRLEASDFVGIVGVSVMTCGGFVFLLMAVSGYDLLSAALLSIVGLVLGYYMPNVWLNTKVANRQREITRAMPDCLDILVISVEAGLGFDAAVRRYTDKARNPLSTEFKRAGMEIRMGRARRDALREMAVRTEVPDLNTFVSAIIQADQLGVSISRVLAVQADQMRVMRRQRAEELAAKASLKMLFPMVLLIFPSIFIVLLGPSLITLLGGQSPF